MSTVARPLHLVSTPKRLSPPVFSFHLVLAALLAAWAFFFCARSVADPDLWWHLTNAQYLIAHHHVPTVDMYSYTVRGTPWIDHEWLSELVFYLAWKVAGLVGLFVLYWLLVEGVLLGMMYLAYKAADNIKAAFVASILGAVLAVVNFGPRSILFGWTYLVVLLVILLRYRRGESAPLWLIPILFCLWINSHGSWLIGLTIFGIIIASGMVSGTWGKIEAVRWRPDQLRKLLVAFAASSAMLFINPYGYKLVWYPFDFAFKQNLVVEHIDEWSSVNFHEPRGKVVLIFLFAIFLSALLHKRRWRLEEVALTLLGVYAGLSHVRLLFLAAILITPILARRLDFLPPYEADIDKPMLNAAIIAFLITIMVTQLPSQAVLENDLARKEPIGGLAYLSTHAKGEHVFNEYMWGSFMMLHTPGITTFIDTRTDIFAHKGILQDYLDVTGIHESLQILEKHKVIYVLYPRGEPLSYLLQNTPAWKLVYQDSVSAVFQKASERRAGQ